MLPEFSVREFFLGSAEGAPLARFGGIPVILAVMGLVVIVMGWGISKLDRRPG